jgi:hypothetical protein
MAQALRNVEATFENERLAREAAEAARRAGLRVTVNTERDTRAALRSEMRDEVESMVAGPGNIGPFTKSMTKGVVVAVPLGAVLGGVLGLLLGLIPLFGLETSTRMWIGFAIGAAAGATTGFVLGGFIKPRMDREGGPLEPEKTITVGIHTSREDEERARRLMERKGATRVAVADAHGRPIGPTSDERARPLGGE